MSKKKGHQRKKRFGAWAGKLKNAAKTRAGTTKAQIQAQKILTAIDVRTTKPLADERFKAPAPAALTEKEQISAACALEKIEID